jgi:oxalate decarboxylase/phosphoglucose isomerase-like protein (cupin superfamily)
MRDFEKNGKHWVEFEQATALRETDAGLLVRVEGEDHWFPKSQISEDSEVYEVASGTGKLIVTEWIAKQRDLI